MRILITGGGGFAGRHLIHYIATVQPDASISATSYYTDEASLPAEATFHQIDLLEEESVSALLDSVRPDVIYHLAAQASPGRSLNEIWSTLETNIRAQLNVLQSCLSLNIRPRILVISSAEIYRTTPPVVMPLTEDTELRPKNPYSLSKITQDMMGLQYFVSHNLPIIRVRPFNHTGPGQRQDFVAPDFAMQIARIEAGLQKPVMNVGNLRPRRDFTDVRDTVRAYQMLVEKGEPGSVYNVASNKVHSVQEILNILLKNTKTDIRVRVDTNKFRPVDVPIIRGDYSRLHALTGWQPEILFETTLRDLLEECRQRLQTQ